MIRLVLPVAACLLLGGCINLDFMWFNPTPLDRYELPDNRIPADLIEEVSFPTVDEETIWGVRAGQRGGPRADVTVLYFHGNCCNIDTYWDRVQLIWDMGYNVFAVDYRGFGRSTGTPTEEGLYLDARAAYAYLLSRFDWPNDGVVFYGFSLGSAVAMDLAVELPPDALIAEAALASSQAFVEDATRLPLSSELVMDTRFDSLGKIASLDTAVLLLHGTADDFVRFEFSELLFEAASEPKRLVAAEGGTHGDDPGPGVPTALGLRYEEELTAWMDRYALGIEP